MRPASIAALLLALSGCAWIIGVNDDPVQVGGSSQTPTPTPTPMPTATAESDASMEADSAPDSGEQPD